MATVIPVDTTRITTVLAHDQADAVAEYKDGNRVEGAQGTDPDTGLPMWAVHVLFMVVGQPPVLAKVKCVSVVAPVLDGVAPFTPVNLVGLTARPYLPKGSTRVETSWKCTGVDVLIAAGKGRDAA